MVETKRSLRTRILQRLVGKPIITQPELAKALKEYAESQRRSQILQANQQDNMIVETPWNYQILVDWAKHNEVLRTVHEAIIKEMVRNRWKSQPKWIRKCPQCGTEFQSETEQCPDCKAETKKPDINQKRILDAFLDDPNPDDEMFDIVTSAVRYMLSTDDWYLSMQDATNGTPFTIYNEDSIFMRVCADEFGRIGNGEYFCTKHKEDPEATVPKGQHCPKHPNAELKETAYIYKDGKIKARFGKDEILHGKPDPWLPSLYGFSKEISCLRIVLSITTMDIFNYDNYNEGKLANILCFEGMSPDEATTLAQEVEKQKNMPKLDVNTGQIIVKKLRTLFLGSPKGPVTNVPAMPDAEKMQSLDWWKLWREIVCAIYGVTPVFTGVVEQGKTGNNPRMQIDVQNNTTEYYQKAFEEPFNNVVVPKLGVTDWIFKFNPVEEKDEMQDITILNAKLDALQKAVNLGLKAELTDEGEVKVSGEPLSLEEKNEMQMQKFKTMQQQTEEKPAFQGKAPFKKEEVFATEKATKKWLVEEVQ